PCRSRLNTAETSRSVASSLTPPLAVSRTWVRTGILLFESATRESTLSALFSAARSTVALLIRFSFGRLLVPLTGGGHGRRPRLGRGVEVLSVRVFEQGPEQFLPEEVLQLRGLLLGHVVRFLGLPGIAVVPVIGAPLIEGLLRAGRVAREA